MPFTFFAHQAFVVPLKWAKPRWFDGSALCIGSMAPDLAYAFIGTRLSFGSHNLPAQLIWTLPVTLWLTHVVRRHLAQPLGSQLPDPLGAEVRALARSRPALGVTAISAVLGGLSHVLVDSFTHPHTWATRRFAGLRHIVYPGITVADALQNIGHTAGTAIGIAIFAALVSRRRISTWNRDQGPSIEASPAESWFWPFVLCGALLGIPAAMTEAISGGGLPVAIIRASWVMFAALTIASLRLRRRSEEPARISTGC